MGKFKTGFEVVKFEKLFFCQFSMKMNQILMDGASTTKKLKTIIGLPNTSKNIIKVAKKPVGDVVAR